MTVLYHYMSSKASVPFQEKNPSSIPPFRWDFFLYPSIARSFTSYFIDASFCLQPGGGFDGDSLFRVCLGRTGENVAENCGLFNCDWGSAIVGLFEVVLLEKLIPPFRWDYSTSCRRKERAYYQDYVKRACRIV